MDAYRFEHPGNPQRYRALGGGAAYFDCLGISSASRGVRVGLRAGGNGIRGAGGGRAEWGHAGKTRRAAPERRARRVKRVLFT